MSLNLICIQLDSVWEDKPANFAKVRELLQDAAPSRNSLVVLPEMFATGFSSNLSETLENEVGPTELFLQEIARSFGVTVVGGLVTAGAEGRGRNQALAIGPAGEILTRYTKMRPFSLGGEGRVHEAGTGPVVFDCGGMRVAPLICYDLRFPELAREAVRLGAEVLVYIAAWPIRRQHHWITLLQARAIENQAYVIGVNRCGADPQFTYSGRSMVIDPHGIVIADAGEQQRVLRASIEAQVLRDWRLQFPGLADAGLLQG
jgi:predicted amidohydrolase